MTNTQIFEEASQWLIELRTDDIDYDKRRGFQSWLDTSPEHVRAYLELVSVWEDSSLLDRAREQDIDSLIALSRKESNVVEFEDMDLILRAVPAKRASRHRLAIAASVLLLGGSVAGAAWYWNSFAHGVYSTAVGQQRTLTLPDDTVVELNADTRIRERYTASERTVELLRGQALFRVAKHPERPFIVVSDGTAVRAVGTQFDVHRKPTGLAITVLEGRVAVTPSDSPRAGGNPDAILSAGQQIVVSSQTPSRTKEINPETATAWTQQKLIFESATLAEAAEEFNRFNSRKLVVESTGLEDFRINGSFPALDPASLPRFLVFLREQPALAVIENGERIQVRKTGSPISANPAL